MKNRTRALSRSVVLACAGVLLAGGGAEGKELIKNRVFASKLAPWQLVSSEEKAKELNWETTDGALRVQVARPAKPQYYRLMQPVKIKEGASYTLSFEARADAEDLAGSPVIVSVCQRDPGWEPYGLRERVVLEPSWKKYEYTFAATEIDKQNEPVVRFLFGNIAGSFFLRSVSLVDQE